MVQSGGRKRRTISRSRLRTRSSRRSRSRHKIKRTSRKIKKNKRRRSRENMKGGMDMSSRGPDADQDLAQRPDADHQILHLMSHETKENISQWLITTMGFGSFLDENLLQSIYALVGSRGGDQKVAAFIGQAYFILQSLFFTNSTLVFADVNIHLLKAMKTIIGGFQNIESFSDLFAIMSSENLRGSDTSAKDLEKIKQILSSDEGTLFEICKSNFLTNKYVLCEASITDEKFIDHLNSYKLDYFSITNLQDFNIPGFWEAVGYLQTSQSELLFIASNGAAVYQFIFAYPSTVAEQAMVKHSMFLPDLDGDEWKDTVNQLYGPLSFVKYVLVEKNAKKYELTRL